MLVSTDNLVERSPGLLVELSGIGGVDAAHDELPFGFSQPSRVFNFATKGAGEDISKAMSLPMLIK